MPTTWMSVRCFDTLASNATGSLHKGDPVIVAGHLITDEWTVGDQPRSEVVLQADAIGHDLNNGISRFTRVHHAPSPVRDYPAHESGDQADSDPRASDARSSDPRDGDSHDREERPDQESRNNFGVGKAEDEDVSDQQDTH